MEFLQRAAALFWPERCVLCDDVVAYQACCCPRCRREAPFLEEPFRLGEIPVVAVWRYQGRVPEAIGRFKFHGDKDAGRGMARLMAAAWRELGPRTRPDCVTFVPMPPERERQRGYNQARLLAQWVGEELELPVLPLLRREGVMMQHHLSAGARRKGVRKAYRLLPEGEDQVPGKRVLLVDDVVTTGGTLGACAGQLRQAGAKGVALLAGAAAG